MKAISAMSLENIYNEIYDDYKIKESNSCNENFNDIVK